MQLSRLWAILAGGLVAVALEGCGGQEKIKVPDVAPATGVLTYKGSPVADADLVFFSVESKRGGWSCAAHCDASGKFEAQTTFFPGTQVKGLVPGDYDVTVFKMEPPPPELSPEEARKRLEKMGEERAKGTYVEPPPRKSLVPEKYNDVGKSNLKVTIGKEGKKDIDLKLED